MSLLTVQRDFQCWLTTESAAAAARLGEGAAPGLAVHFNNYRSQLLHCLRENFTALRGWIADDAFEATAVIHIDRVPPSSWTLDAYVRDFPATVAARYPDRPGVGELAALDLAMSDAFIGPDAIPVTAEMLGQPDWDKAILRFVPTLNVLRLRTNAHAVWQALDAGMEPPSMTTATAEPVPVLVWRQDLVSAFRVLDPREADALACISGGMTFGALCAMLVDREGEVGGTACAGAWLGQWLRDGLIASIESA